GDHRWEETQETGEHRRGEEGEQAGDDDGTVDGGQGCDPALPVGDTQSDRDDGGHRGGGHTLDDGEPHTDVLADADGLDQRGDATGEQIGVDEVDGGGGIQVQRLCDEQGNDDRSGVERQNVLQAQGSQFGCWWHLINRMYSPGGGLSSHGGSGVSLRPG